MKTIKVRRGSAHRRKLPKSSKLLKIAEIENPRFLSVSQRLRGEDFLSVVAESRRPIAECFFA